MKPATVEERLELLEQEREILRTLYQYGHTLDHGPEPEFLDCFTEDGVWESLPRQIPSRPPREFRRFESRAGLVRFFRQHTHAPELYHKHLVVEPRITVQGGSATVESYYVRIDEHPDGPYIRGFGRYQDRLRRCPDGRWRFELRHVESEDYADKLAR